MKVDTGRGYERKPKAKDGYELERNYCECGCKQGYWYYVKIKRKNKVK